MPGRQIVAVAEDSNSLQRVFLGLGIALLVLLLLGLPFGWFGWWSDNSWGDALGMMLMMIFLGPILIVVLIVVLIVALVNKGKSSSAPAATTPAPASRPPAAAPSWEPTEDPDPLVILERRYAAGQITRAEYQRMRRDLQ